MLCHDRPMEQSVQGHADQCRVCVIPDVQQASASAQKRAFCHNELPELTRFRLRFDAQLISQKLPTAFILLQCGTALSHLLVRRA